MGAENLPPIEMVDIRPFMMNAYRDWIIASNCTPYVKVLAERAVVPREYVRDGKIILNTSPRATKDFLVNENGMMFSARFSGRDFPVFVPLGNVEAIYAKENGEGCTFASYEDLSGAFNDSDEVPVTDPPKKVKPTLTVVK